MLKAKFIEYLKSNRFDNNIFKDYYEEVNTKKEIVFDIMHFNMFIMQSGHDVNLILNDLIIPYYKRKFNINELKDKEGNRIKIVDEQITKKD